MLVEHVKRQNPWVIALVLALIIVGGYRALFAAPAAFPTDSVISIARGAAVSEVAQQLYEEHIIAHRSVLELILRVIGKSGSVQAGAYRFVTRENVFTIAGRLISGAYDIPPIRVTLPEGITVREIGALLVDALPEIKLADFLKAALPREGYLFPDTYVFTPSSTPESIVAVMRTNFDSKVAPLQSAIQASHHSLSDIITMASILEREARTLSSKRMVAGILWNRLARGMPLQVDAVFGYIFSRDTYSPSYADLKIDSPYNTYLHTGLPPGPICNPGLDSLDAAINPTKSDYLYYLTGKDNLMHYATTYAAHMANQRKYLQ